MPLPEPSRPPMYDDLMPDPARTRDLAHRFPRDFVWGVATSAFQIEGAAQADGKAESIWDRFCRRPGAIADGSTGDIACDHHRRLESDLDLIASLGVDAYRFSVAWTRIEPDAGAPWNTAGLDFYDRLVDGLCRRGIAPHLTLNHWDLPQWLQDSGGWGARETVHAFVRYARVVSRRLGDRCATITTHNEPWVVAMLGHESGVFAPGIRNRAMALQVAHHLLVSHGEALVALRADGCRAELGIVLNLAPSEPATADPRDAARARLDDARGLRWYCDALFHGHYPGEAWESFGADAPLVQPGDMQTIAQPLDFLGVNYYTRHVASAGEPWDAAARGLPVTAMGWEVCPRGLCDLLVRLQRDYAPRRMLVTENGAAFDDVLEPGGVADHRRVQYLVEHIEALAEARRQGASVGGYMVWSLMDNFEWTSGYTRRFGLVHVDFASLERTLKASGHWYRSLLQHTRAMRSAAAGRMCAGADAGAGR